MATNGASSKANINGQQSPEGAVQPAATGQAQLIPGLGKQPAGTNPLSNGDHDVPGSEAYPTPNGISHDLQAHANMPGSITDLPEEILHITENFSPLGTLITRVGEECFNKLAEAIDKLAAISIAPAQSLTNGSGSHAPPPIGGDTSSENKEKKKIMLEFANDFRTKFIKLLVIAHWSGNAKEVSKLIDLLNWGNGQSDITRACADRFIDIMYEMRDWKIPNPDLETALAVLSKADVPWIPHFNMRDKKPLQPQEILRTVQQMNTLINLRLVLHEELIPQLRAYEVANGRATFRMPNEFELDVYVASDKYTDPWYFLDVRFLFNPAPQIRGDMLRGQMDSALNRTLAEGGLRGAFEFVHNFVLTHKLGILHQQAGELQRGIWSDALRLERVHRTLTLQYWAESPQKKSWIEIGVSSGKDHGRRRKEDLITSHVSVRWMRNGLEHTDPMVPLDVKDLSVERILEAHIARHASYILATAGDALEAASHKHNPTGQSAFRMELRTSDDRPADCYLRAQLGHHPAMDLQIDSITGGLYLIPAGAATAQAQEALLAAKDPVTEAPAILHRVLTYDIVLRIERLADLAGWSFVGDFKLDKTVINEATKRETDRFGLFKPRGFASSHWYIMYTVNLSGERWWAVEIDSAAAGTSLKSVRPLTTEDANGRQQELTLQTFKMIEQSAIRTSAYYLANNELAERGVTTKMTHIPMHLGNSLSTSPNLVSTAPVLMVRFAQLVKSKISQWASDMLQIQCTGFHAATGQVSMRVMGYMKGSRAVEDILQRVGEEHAHFGQNGFFEIIVRNKPGESCIPQIITQLKKLGTLFNMVRVLKERGLVCTYISFQKLSFRSADDLQSTVHIHSTRHGTQIKLQVAPTAPHHRIRPLLETTLNDPEWGFERFTKALECFHPVLRAFQTLEKRHETDMLAAPDIFPRTVDQYRLQYPNKNRAELPYVIFDLSFKRNKDELEWRVGEMTAPQMREEREKLFPGLNAVIAGLMSSVGNGWTGMNTLLIASSGGVEEAILKFDEVIWAAMLAGRAEGADRDAPVKEEHREAIVID